MNSKWHLLIIPLFLLAGLVHAQEGRVIILSPMDGSTLPQSPSLGLNYRVESGTEGDHVHVYVDDNEVGILRSMEGRYELRNLAAGQRNICIKVVNRAHVPTGVESCVQVRITAPGSTQQPAAPSPPPARRGYSY